MERIRHWTCSFINYMKRGGSRTLILNEMDNFLSISSPLAHYQKNEPILIGVQCVKRTEGHSWTLTFLAMPMVRPTCLSAMLMAISMQSMYTLAPQPRHSTPQSRCQGQMFYHTLVRCQTPVVA